MIGIRRSLEFYTQLSSSRNGRVKTRGLAVESLESRRLLTEVGGSIAADTTWVESESPYLVVQNITVEVGATLKIEPGVQIDFRTGTGIDVEGRLLAEGTPWKRIQFDAATSRWEGVSFDKTLADNRISYADMRSGDGQGEAINVDESRLLLDNIVWTGTRSTILELDHPSLIVRNSHFPTSGDGEIIHGNYIEGDEYLIIDGNVFANSNNGGDVVDFLGAERPGPVLQVLNNVFLGGGDDGLDLDGTDAHIEGNLFMNFQNNSSRSTTSNAIATGLPQSGEDNRTEITVVRNVFIDNDHSILLKEDSFATVENNVFVGGKEAVIQFTEVNGTSVRGPGKGAYLDGNIMWNNASLFKNLVNSNGFRTEITVNRSVLPNAAIDFAGTSVQPHDFGVGNLDVDPMFVDATGFNFRLQPNSPAKSAGPGGLDIGAYVASAVTLLADSEGSTLTVGGPGVTEYLFRSDDGEYLGPFGIDSPIDLANVDAAAIEVIARNDAGEWLTDASAAFHEHSAKIVSPNRVRVGERLPLAVQAINQLGHVNSNLTVPTTFNNADEVSDTDLRIKKGVGTATPIVNATADFELRLDDAWAGPQLLSARTPTKSIQIIDDSFPIVEHSGTIDGNVTWSSDVEHRITSDLTVLANSELTIESGTRVLLADQVNLLLTNATLRVLGTEADPVLFSSITGDAWGGVEIDEGQMDLNYTFFTNGGADESRVFGHSDSQAVIRAKSGATLNCNHCFIINNVGKGVGTSDDSIVNIESSVISQTDTGGEFRDSLVTVSNTYVTSIPNDDGVFVDDDNDGLYFNGVHESGEASVVKNSFVIDTKDDGLDHNGARLRVLSSWVEGAMHEGLASSNDNDVFIDDSVFTRNNQGVEAGYGSPDVTIRNSVIAGNVSKRDPDQLINAGLRFGDGYDGQNGSYEGHISASEIVLVNNDDNVRNFDGSIPGPIENAIDIDSSLTNDAEFDGKDNNLSGVAIFDSSMHLLRASAGFEAGAGGLPIGRRIQSTTYELGSVLPGDFDADSIISVNDVNLLCTAILSNNAESRFDLNADGNVDRLDHDVMIVDIAGTTFGDANLDGTFNSSDLVLVFQAGEFEDTTPGNSQWAEGDWNCDGDFSTGDLVTAFQAGGFSNAARIDRAGDVRSDLAVAVLTIPADEVERNDKLSEKVRSNRWIQDEQMAKMVSR